MPHSRLWDVNKPVGNITQAKNIDEEFRNLKVDLEERLEESLIQDMTADPVLAKDDLRGIFTDKRYIITSKDFDGADLIHDDATPMYTRINSGRASAGIPFGLGNKITKLEVLASKVNGVDMSISIVRADFAANNNWTVLYTTNWAPTIGVKTLFTSPVLDLTLSDSYIYYLLIINNPFASSILLYGAKITRNTDGNRAW